MPRYRYRCDACETEQIIFHRISETIVLCPQCNISHKIYKMLTTPTIVVKSEQEAAMEVGELTREYIEANRDILKQQIEEAKKDTYEPS